MNCCGRAEAAEMVVGLIVLTVYKQISRCFVVEEIGSFSLIGKSVCPQQTQRNTCVYICDRTTRLYGKKYFRQK